MAKAKIVKKSTETDMTPFVDVAFLILCFFILATKIKAPEPVATKPPGSVSSKSIPENKTLLITIDSASKVYLSVLSKDDETIAPKLIEDLNKRRNLNLTPSQMANFPKTQFMGTGFSQLGQFLDLPDNQRNVIKQDGIPVLDSLQNELEWWIASAKTAFADGETKVNFLIKGDSKAKYPAFEAVVNAFRKNEEMKYYLITNQEQAPQGSDLYNSRQKGLTQN